MTFKWEIEKLRKSFPYVMHFSLITVNMGEQIKIGNLNLLQGFMLLNSHFKQPKYLKIVFNKVQYEQSKETKVGD